MKNKQLEDFKNFWLQKDIESNPDDYTYWLKDCLQKVIEKIN